ncbi:MAG: hypothetical protein AVDCRST_MAG56-3192 [uncultured Cytophagales bacterium]|uniref:Uncharacterized protein n=1 Tax=uncultured Cytophagales bacterium TaxID=158755 RepID=A0A6J4J6V3_9SPHI|nr:MAG: hypothetical protein AVDCRST_MAG56-3192 [uncultured Cytophagales bacterium]
MLTRVFAAGACWGIFTIGFPSFSLAAARLFPATGDTLYAAAPASRPLGYHQVLEQASRLERLRYPWLPASFPTPKRVGWKIRHGERYSATPALLVGPTGVAMGDFVFVRLALDRPRRLPR